MNKEKIAVIVDSGCDITPELQKDLPIFRLPLRVIIDGEEFANDDISPDVVYSALETQKVTTSLPSGKDILETIEELKKEGYTHIIAVTISSGLSGTNNVLNNLKNEVEGIEISVIDTLNISLGSGTLGLLAAEYVVQGKSFDEIVRLVNAKVKASKIFFTVDSLEYLQRGGRIGLVAGTVASILNIKPIISCNEDGIYYTVSKVRTYNKSITKMIELAKEFIGDATNYQVTIVEVNTKYDKEDLIRRVQESIPNTQDVIVTKVSSALGVHTGPEAIGIAVLILD